MRREERKEEGRKEGEGGSLSQAAAHLRTKNHADNVSRDDDDDDDGDSARAVSVRPSVRPSVLLAEKCCLPLNAAEADGKL